MVWVVRLVGEVVNRPEEGGRNAKRNTNQHRGPGAVVVGLKNCEDHKQQCCEDSAQDQSAAAVVVHGGLSIPVKWSSHALRVCLKRMKYEGREMKESLNESTADWRRIFGALANEETRRSYAQVILGIDSDLLPARREKALKNLQAAGLVTAEGLVDDGVYARTLAVGATRAPKDGIARFLDADGRIDRYPKNQEDRVELLQAIGAKAIQHGEELKEPDLTLRLENLADDAVLLRRYLVDYGVVIRRPDGSAYRLADGSD